MVWLNDVTIVVGIIAAVAGEKLWINIKKNGTI